MSLVERIKSECIKKNFTIAYLERAACLGNGTIRRWDTNAPSVDKLSNIAHLLNVSLDYLYYGEENFKKNNINLNPYEQELINTYNHLDSRGQHRVHTIIYEELDRIENSKKNKTCTG